MLYRGHEAGVRLTQVYYLKFNSNCLRFKVEYQLLHLSCKNIVKQHEYYVVDLKRNVNPIT